MSNKLKCKQCIDSKLGGYQKGFRIYEVTLNLMILLFFEMM